MEKEMQYYLADVSELIPYVRNARTHSEAQVSQIAASIRAVSYTHLTLPTTERV